MADSVSTMGVGVNIKSVNQKSWFPWLVVMTAAFFFFYEFIILNIFNALNEALVTEFGISEAQMRNLSAFYMYANIIFLFPSIMFRLGV